MSETTLNETSEGFLSDGDAPRLSTSAAPMIPDIPSAAAFTNVDSGPTLPVVSQVLTDGSAPTLPTLPAPTLPSPLTSAIADVTAAVVAEEAEKVDVREHPMAHLMPQKSKPSEASLRAAELRAAKKKKTRKTRIIVGVVSLAVLAVVGPPLAKWTMDAVNQAGSVEQDDSTVPPTTASVEDLVEESGGDPQATPSAGLQAIEDAKQLAGDTTPPVAP